jgi:hypothetical protein
MCMVAHAHVHGCWRLARRAPHPLVCEHLAVFSGCCAAQHANWRVQPAGGVLPNIHASLLQKKKGKSGGGHHGDDDMD